MPCVWNAGAHTGDLPERQAIGVKKLVLPSSAPSAMLAEAQSVSPQGQLSGMVMPLGNFVWASPQAIFS